MQGRAIVNIVELTQPPAEPVTLADARLQVNINDDITASDGLLTRCIRMARDNCENRLSRAFIRRKFQLRMNMFPFAIPVVCFPQYSLESLPNQTAGVIPIPYPPLASVESIEYTAPDGTVLTLDPSQYQVELGGKFQGLITPIYGHAFPPTQYSLASSVVNFTAGYGDVPADVPAGIQGAMLMQVAHWYRNREATAPGGQLPTEIEMGVNSLLAPYEWGFYG